MQSKSLTGLVLVTVGLFGCLNARLAGQSVSDCTLQLSVQGQSDPPQITLLWPALDGSIAYVLSRKNKEEAAWGESVLLPSTTTNYVDTNVVIGAAYEYHVFRSATNCDSDAYALAAIALPVVDSRGKVVLVVDSSVASQLPAELTLLQQDLVGDGWTVLRHDVPRMAVDPANLDLAVGKARSNEVAAVRNTVRAEYLADRTNVQAVFLLGHVPVPYAGALDPDGHPDHRGAWPSDAFYGDMDGTWTDSSVNITTAADPRNQNVPGDGKFDQSSVPGVVALGVGRVDLANLPALQIGEVEALRRYLQKDHQFRNRFIVAHERALIDDNFGNLSGELPAANGWANFAPMFGSNIVTGRWLSDATQDDYLWAYGCGSGTYTGVAGVVSTTHFLVYDIRVVFTTLFGSYFGDWDTPNNVLRAPLAGGTYTLTSAWTGRPPLNFHRLALGETFGDSIRLSQNNSGLYQPPAAMKGFYLGGINPNDYWRGVQVALMGDPTLRLHVVAPPGPVTAMTNQNGGVELDWSASLDDVVGYHVYRSAAPTGPYARLTTAPVSATQFVDPRPGSENCYMVRAVKLQHSNSGTYFNTSQGAFAQAVLASPETQTNTWPALGSSTWNFTDISGTIGGLPGWDSLTLDNALTINATPAAPFTIRVVSSDDAGLPAPPAHFNNNHAYEWPIVTVLGGVTGFDPANLSLVTSGFLGDLAGGTFQLALAGASNRIDLLFNPNHPPIASPAMYSREWDQPLRVQVSDLLARFTSDPDGDERALLQIGSSTNGTAIITDGDSLLFTSPNNLEENVTYWIQDIRPYRLGDSIRVASNTLTIEPLPKGSHFDAYHAIELEFQGEAGKQYQVQARLETELVWKNQGDPVTATGDKQSFFERASNVTKFYRIILVQ